MSALDDLRKRRSSSSASALEESSTASSERSPLPPGEDPSEEGSSNVDVPTEVEPSAEAEATSTSEEPRGVSQVVTPSGTEIYFQAAPKRLYRIRQHGPDDYLPADVGWTGVPSMSDCLGILDKPGLPWWGMKIGVAGLMQLIHDGIIWFNEEGGLATSGSSPETWIEVTEEIAVDLLTANRLTVNHVRDSAGDRGTAIHDALEAWAEKGVMPKVDVYAPEEQGYVQGLLDFLIDSGAEPVRSEVMVGSVEHRFAGRYDLDALIPNGAEVVVKTYPKRKPKRERIEGGVWKTDLKTSKSVYVTHMLQLEGYEVGAVECGYEPTVARGVIHVTEDGRYEFVRSTKTGEDFLKVRAAYDAVQK